MGFSKLRRGRGPGGLFLKGEKVLQGVATHTASNFFAKMSLVTNFHTASSSKSAGNGMSVGSKLRLVIAIHFVQLILRNLDDLSAECRVDYRAELEFPRRRRSQW